MIRQSRLWFFLGWTTFLCFQPNSSFATAAADPDYSVSVVGGVTLTTSTISDTQAAAMQTYSMTQSMGVGVMFGGLLTYHAIEDWEFEIGALFSRRQINYSFSTILVGTEHVDLNYLEFPLVARYSFSPNFSGGGGAYYAQSIGGVSISSDTPGVPSSTNSTATKTDDFGLLLDLRLSTDLESAIKLFADARYLFGLLNVNSPTVTAGNTYFRGFEILGGLQFPL